MMLLYHPRPGPRLHYVAGFIGQQLTGMPVRVTADLTEWQQHEGLRINYSEGLLAAQDFHLVPEGLLEETGLRQTEPPLFDCNGHPAFFPTGGDYPFDILAATFYLLSRYEEYRTYTPDTYGRYPHQQSLAFRGGFLHQPLINIWLRVFSLFLTKRCPSFYPAPSSFHFAPTYDIDEAFCYRHKQGWRQAGGFLKDLFGGRWKQCRLRSDVLAGRTPDPYDTFDWMHDLHRPAGIKPVFFFLVAARNKGVDRHILPSVPAFRRLIQKQAERGPVGLHPSWQSGDDPSLLQKEKAELEKITGQKITRSRQHFIRFRLPVTYRQLLEAGITDDYSMGYGSINGFRASVASPFYWYDLEREQATSLQLHPFCYMEANSFFEQGQSPQQALEEMRQYAQAVRNVHGTLSTIWHNTFLGTSPYYPDWREVYQAFFGEVAG